jgi:hypothetical protein
MKKLTFLFAAFFPVMLFGQWLPVETPGGVYYFNNIKFFDENTGFLLGNESYFKMTQDGGATWTSVEYPDQAAAMNDCFLFDSQVIVALSDLNTLFAGFKVSDNTGISWDDVSNTIFLPQAAGFYNSGLGFCGATEIINANPVSCIYRLDGTGPEVQYQKVMETTLQGYFDNFLCVSEEVVLASYAISDENPPLPQYTGLLLLSSDHGNSWQELFQLEPNHQFMKLGLSITGDCVYALAPGKIYYSTDEGQSWVSETTDLRTVELISREMAYGVRVTSGFGSMVDTFNVVYTSNGWETVATQLKIPFDPSYADQYNHLLFVNETTGFYAFNHQLYKTTNGGFVSVNENIATNSFKIAITPNPANEIVNFEFGNFQNLQQAQLRCYDVFGSLLHSEPIMQGQKEVVLDISSWPPGMYVAVVYSNGGVVGKSKFVVE